MNPIPIPITHVTDFGRITAPPPLPFMRERTEANATTHIAADNPVHILRIQVAVSEAFGVPLWKLLTKDRTPYVVFPRQIAMFLCRKLTRCTFSTIGVEFGNRDHGTVIHAFNTISDRMDTEPKTRATVQALIEQLKA